MKYVVEYFLETYGFSIQNTSLPCLQAGNQQRPNYLPMEVCLFDYLFMNFIPRDAFYLWRIEIFIFHS